MRDSLIWADRNKASIVHGLEPFKHPVASGWPIGDDRRPIESSRTQATRRQESRRRWHTATPLRRSSARLPNGSLCGLTLRRVLIRLNAVLPLSRPAPGTAAEGHHRLDGLEEPGNAIALPGPGADRTSSQNPTVSALAVSTSSAFHRLWQGFSSDLGTGRQWASVLRGTPDSAHPNHLDAASTENFAGHSVAVARGASAFEISATSSDDIGDL